MRVRVRALALREHPLECALSFALEQKSHALDLHEIDTDTDDHLGVRLNQRGGALGVGRVSSSFVSD